MVGYPAGVVPVTCVMLILQGVSETIKSFYVAMGWEEPEIRVKEIH